MPGRKGPNSKTELSNLSFEEAFNRLAEQAESLENGNLTLMEATVCYEEGMSLALRCAQLLNETELKISQIKESFAAPIEEELLWEDESNEE